MANRQIFKDVSAIGLIHPGANGVVGTGADDTSYNMLADTMSASLALENALVNAQGLTSLHEVNEQVKAGAVLELRSKSTATNAVNNLDMSAFTIGGTNYLAAMRSLNLGLSFTHDEGSGASSKWQEPQVTGCGYSIDSELLIPLSAALGLQTTGFGNAAATALELAVAFTLNSVQFSFPGTLRSSTWGAEVGQNQRLNVSLAGNGAETVNTGVTSLLAAAVNDPRTFVQAIVTTHATASVGVTITGNYVFESVSVRFADASLVETTYRMRSTGEVTSVVVS